jgi:hypothetical protein
VERWGALWNVKVGCVETERTAGKDVKFEVSNLMSETLSNQTQASYVLTTPAYNGPLPIGNILADGGGRAAAGFHR